MDFIWNMEPEPARTEEKRPIKAALQATSLSSEMSRGRGVYVDQLEPKSPLRSGLIDVAPYGLHHDGDQAARLPPQEARGIGRAGLATAAADPEADTQSRLLSA
jgi:hypothetical protein